MDEQDLIEEYEKMIGQHEASVRKRKQWSYNKLARHFTDAFNDDYAKLMVLEAIDNAHMASMLSEELIEYLLDRLNRRLIE